MHICMCIYVFMYVYMCVHIYICVYVHVYVCMCLYVYICMCVYMCIYVCVEDNRNCLSASIIWVLRTNLGLLGLVASTFT
jgi:type IV secretory pathway VirB3-like protein